MLLVCYSLPFPTAQGLQTGRGQTKCKEKGKSAQHKESHPRQDSNVLHPCVQWPCLDCYRSVQPYCPRCLAHTWAPGTLAAGGCPPPPSKTCKIWKSLGGNLVEITCKIWKTLKIWNPHLAPTHSSICSPPRVSLTSQDIVPRAAPNQTDWIEVVCDTSPPIP
jgi:hypothetical protein